MRQPTERQCSCVLSLKYTFICVYWWTRQRIHNTLIVVDRYLRLMGDKTIPDSAESRLESFYPPFVAGIDLPHQGVVDSYNLHQCWNHDGVIKWKHFPRYWPFVRGIHGSPVNFSHKGHWRGALMLSVICSLNKQLSKKIVRLVIWDAIALIMTSL